MPAQSANVYNAQPHSIKQPYKLQKATSPFDSNYQVELPLPAQSNAELLKKTIKDQEASLNEYIKKSNQFSSELQILKEKVSSIYAQLKNQKPLSLNAGALNGTINELGILFPDQSAAACKGLACPGTEGYNLQIRKEIKEFEKKSSTFKESFHELLQKIQRTPTCLIDSLLINSTLCSSVDEEKARQESCDYFHQLQSINADFKSHDECFTKFLSEFKKIHTHTFFENKRLNLEIDKYGLLCTEIEKNPIEQAFELPYQKQFDESILHLYQFQDHLQRQWFSALNIVWDAKLKRELCFYYLIVDMDLQALDIDFKKLNNTIHNLIEEIETSPATPQNVKELQTFFDDCTNKLLGIVNLVVEMNKNWFQILNDQTLPHHFTDFGIYRNDAEETTHKHNFIHSYKNEWQILKTKIQQTTRILDNMLINALLSEGLLKILVQENLIKPQLCMLHKETATTLDAYVRFPFDIALCKNTFQNCKRLHEEVSQQFDAFFKSKPYQISELSVFKKLEEVLPIRNSSFSFIENSMAKSFDTVKNLSLQTWIECAICNLLLKNFNRTLDLYGEIDLTNKLVNTLPVFFLHLKTIAFSKDLLAPNDPLLNIHDYKNEFFDYIHDFENKVINVYSEFTRPYFLTDAVIESVFIDLELNEEQKNACKNFMMTKILFVDQWNKFHFKSCDQLAKNLKMLFRSFWIAQDLTSVCDDLIQASSKFAEFSRLISILHRDILKLNEIDEGEAKRNRIEALKMTLSQLEKMHLETESLLIKLTHKNTSIPQEYLSSIRKDFLNEIQALETENTQQELPLLFEINMTTPLIEQLNLEFQSNRERVELCKVEIQKFTPSSSLSWWW